MKPPRTSLPLCTVLVPIEERRQIPRLFGKVTGCVNAQPVTLFGTTYEPQTLQVISTHGRTVPKLGAIRVRVRVAPVRWSPQIVDAGGACFTVDRFFEPIDFNSIGKL